MTSPLRLAVAFSVVAALGACGGGDDDVAATPAPAPAPAPAPVPPPPPPAPNLTISVVDGKIKNALVCLDANSNGLCDTGELQGTTDANGKVSLTVPTADLNKSPVVAIVSTSSEDADSGPVTVAYTMKAPADSPTTVSPLTTQVQGFIETMGVTTAQAANVVKAQANLLVSPLDDFTASTDANSVVAARVARVLTAVAQKQMTALAASVGVADSSGGTISQADIALLIRRAQSLQLNAIGGAAVDADLAAKCANLADAACKTAIDTAATSVVGQSLLSAATAPQLAGVQKLFATAAASTAPGPASSAAVTLDFVQAGDANNWYYRALSTNAAGAVVDSNGFRRSTDQRKSNVNGTITDFSFVGDPARQGDVHWNGTAWVSCKVGDTFNATVPDGKGFSSSSFCDGQNVNKSQRVSVDISGKPMADVITTIQTTRPGASQYAKPPTWYTGTTPVTVGAATFPAGSTMIPISQIDIENAPSYDARTSNQLSLTSADVSAGADTRVTAGAACGDPARNSVTTPATSLDTVILQNKGTPCIFQPGTFTLNGQTITHPTPHEWWGQSSISIGQVGSAPTGATPRTAYYTTNTLIRVAFTGSGANAATFYSCLQRWDTGSPSNCKPIGTGTYAIATVGDARVVSFTGVPAQAAPLGYDRVFVERGGRVYFGFRNKLSSNYAIRLNEVAGNALLTRLGMPNIAP